MKKHEIIEIQHEFALKMRNFERLYEHDTENNMLPNEEAWRKVKDELQLVKTKFKQVLEEI